MITFVILNNADVFFDISKGILSIMIYARLLTYFYVFPSDPYYYDFFILLVRNKILLIETNSSFKESSGFYTGTIKLLYAKNLFRTYFI